MEYRIPKKGEIYRHFKDKDTAKCYLTEQQIGMLIANQSVIAKNNAQKQYMNDEKDLENIMGGIPKEMVDDIALENKDLFKLEILKQELEGGFGNE